MRYDFAHHHLLSRRDALRLGAAGAAAAAAAPALGLFTPAGASTMTDDVAGGELGVANQPEWNDTMFDIAAAEAGGWAPSRFGVGDQRGALNWLTAAHTAQVLSMLDTSRPIHSYQLGEELFNDFPAFPSTPKRGFELQLYVLGYDAGPDFKGIQSGKTPLGSNHLTAHEERFKENFTHQIATQLDGLNHVGIGETYYNGFKAKEFITPTGTTALGNETMGPIVTRGVILDIVGLKMAQGHTEDFFIEATGKPVLRGNYRITIDDIHHAMYRQRISKPFGVGDVPIFHTGWTHLARSDSKLYLSQEPGIFLAEARYFISHACSIVAGDTWGLEVLDPDITQGTAFPVHQELIVHEGIRIGESFVTDSAIAENVYDGVLIITPQNVPGATCGSTPPMLLGQPGPAPRRAQRHQARLGGRPHAGGGRPPTSPLLAAQNWSGCPPVSEG